MNKTLCFLCIFTLSWIGISCAATVNDYVTECTENQQNIMLPELCECVGKKAKDKLNAEEFDLFYSMAVKDDASLNKHNIEIKPPVKVKVIMFLKKGPLECANEFASQRAINGGAAPYAIGAVEKIYAAQKIIEPPKYDKKDSQEDRARSWVEYERKLFQKAGYDYDETIKKVVYDMRHYPERIPKTNENDSVFGLIYVSLHMWMSDCKNNKIDCLQFFPSETADSVKWLVENTDFSF